MTKAARRRALVDELVERGHLAKAAFFALLDKNPDLRQLPACEIERLCRAFLAGADYSLYIAVRADGLNTKVVEMLRRELDGELLVTLAEMPTLGSA